MPFLFGKIASFTAYFLSFGVFLGGFFWGLDFHNEKPDE